DDLRGRFACLPIEALEMGICHGDLHGGNACLGPDGRLTFFDFDCCGVGYRAYEVAVFRWAAEFFHPDQKGEARWGAFLRAYTARRTLAELDLAAVPLFVAARQFWLM